MHRNPRLVISILVVLAALLTASMAMAQAPSPQGPASKPSEKDMHGLMIYGKGFLIFASEPDGWDANTDAAAREYQSNVVFFPRDPESRKNEVNIRVRLNKKTTEDPEEDMLADVQGYKKQYPETKFQPLTIRHPECKTSAKLFYTPGDYYEYVAYVNPGKQHSLMFSITMSKSRKEATPQELAAYEHVLQSLRLVETSN
jgi:hypothetical protein